MESKGSPMVHWIVGKLYARDEKVWEGKGTDIVAYKGAVRSGKGSLGYIRSLESNTYQKLMS